ncbi:urease accessory protein UreD [Xylophilus rhododendri]|uniref:Urease accessory protein UreD n=1 Tax=Xylophilus rhododendri TaxID=2697032 RepID=A0A857J786_9BURK|nr:urease accessory protein UreD [Xylophilus rhododendri]QHI99567.1 urease accessory protein UreD [Xylophilus rhododendri]
MPWHAHLELNYTRDPHNPARTVARHLHEGPLRILQSLYPEGEGICHNVLVHPPGGLVGGDVLDIAIEVGARAHGLLTTPGAARFYRSQGEVARQLTRIALAENARLEWLPQEAICYDACDAENRLSLRLAEGAQLIGWDVSAFGLPHAGLPFLRGRLRQHIEIPGVWLERGTIDAADSRLLDGPLGLAGHRCMATAFLACGTAMARTEREHALEAARAVIEAHPLCHTAGVTSPDARLIVVRVLAPVVEPAMDLLRAVRGAWRQACWGLAPTVPRIWNM